MAAAGPDSPSAADSSAGSALADPPPGTPDSAIPYLSTRYYITHLPERLREDFDRLYTAAAAFETSCKLPVRISGADAELLMMVLLYDCPEMFQISRNAEYQIWTVNGEVTEIEIPYSMPLSLYEKKLEQCEGLIRSIGEELQGLSDAEKERRVYDILAGTVSYETEKEDDSTAYGALIRHRAKCDGISLAMKWLMDSFGIPSLVLSGREAGDPRGHAWNSIMINGKYRDVDVTNDTREEGKLMNLYGAYNIDRSWIASIYPLTGVIADHFDVPPSGGMEESFHVLDGSFVPAGTDAADASFALFDRAYSGGGLARLQFEAEEDYRSFLESFEENTQNWFQTNVLGGSVLLNSLDAFRTVAVQVEFDGQEDIKD